MRQLALFSLMLEEQKTEDRIEDARFRSQIIAYHLGEAKKVLDIIDAAQEKGEFAPELSEEEMEEYEPLSTEEATHAIAMLRQFGVAVQ